MRAGRLLLPVAAVAAVFTVVLMLTFPTELLMRRAVESLTPAGGPRLVFEHAWLRPWGLHVEKLALERPDGTALADADWLTLTPSLTGLAHGLTGRPWRARLGAWGGTLDATLDREGSQDSVVLVWKDLDVARSALVAGVSGVMEGRATVRPPPAPGEGYAIVRQGSWQGASVLVPGVGVLHADPAIVRWALRGNLLTLGMIELSGPELRVTGTGTVQLAEPLGNSLLDLDLALASGPDAPPVLLDVVERLPPASATTRRLVIGGTLDAPRPVQ